MFRKVLIANRGEIAIRIERALRELDITSVAVYSDADANAPHALQADEAYLLGAAEPAASYLNQERLLEVAEQAGCDAVHPGYGFLSENAVFARLCEATGLVFIGPPARAIEEMGSKLRARARMAAAGVPVVPGSEDYGGDWHRLERAASAMQYPVVIKASAGGGGKGMRLVMSPEDFASAAEAASAEATRAFGDDTLYVEKYIIRPRHVEMQVFADAHGNFVHLFERECSIQRRHQKILEESPSLALNSALRRRMGEAAVAAARAVDYRGAGTIEFLLDANNAFYFLEMNTRLQVEHPVTEMVTGLDLVRLQIEVAAGERLALPALQPALNGHALECRVYAEDPELGFLPVSGRIQRVSLPGGPGVRVDAALRDGQDVSIHYDPLLAKVITYASDRDGCIVRMRRALAEFAILGIPTNLQFLQAVLENAAFVRGELSTHFIPDHMPEWRPEAVAVPDAGLAAVVLHELVGGAAAGSGGAAGHAERTPSPWDALPGWR